MAELVSYKLNFAIAIHNLSTHVFHLVYETVLAGDYFLRPSTYLKTKVLRVVCYRGGGGPLPSTPTLPSEFFLTSSLDIHPLPASFRICRPVYNNFGGSQEVDRGSEELFCDLSMV